MLDEIICEVIDCSIHFENQGYFKTATQIVSLAKLVDEKKISSIKEIIEETFKIAKTFCYEFAQSSSIGKSFRKRCYIQTQEIIFTTLLSVDSNKLVLSPELSQFAEKMNNSDRSINPMSASMSDLFRKQNKTFEEKINLFSQACFTYQIALEGIFSQVIKQLYGLMCVANGKTPVYANNDTSAVWNVFHNFEKDFGFELVAIENWPEKSSLRNAIAHAQAQYDPILDLTHFHTQDLKTGQTTYEKDMSFNEFFTIWMEVADAIDSLRYSIRLYGILQSLIHAHLKISKRQS